MKTGGFSKSTYTGILMGILITRENGWGNSGGYTLVKNWRILVNQCII